MDDEERCRALIGLAESLRFTEELDEELSTLEMAERLATAYQLSPELSHLYQMRASAHFFRGETEQCLEAATAALEHARIAGNPRLEARALSFRADAEYLGARMVTAHGYYTQCLELAREHGFGRVIASNLGQRGNTAWYKADVREAVDDSLEAAELCVKVHDQRAEMNAWVSAGIFIAWSGDVDEGERLVWRGIEVARSIESAFFHSYVFAVGRIAAQCGKFDEAERLAAEGVEILRSTQSGMTFLGPCALGVLARTTKDPKRRDAALGEAETLLAGGSVSHNYLEFYPDAIETALQIGDWPEAERYAQALEDYSSGQPLPLSTFYVNRGRGLAAHGRGNHDESTRDWLKELHDQATRIPLQWTLPALEQALRAYD